MLRVQLTAISNITKSRLLDQNLNIREDIEELRQMLDDVHEGDLEEIQKILEDTTVLYDQISRGIVIPSQSDSWTMTEAAEAESDYSDEEEDTKQDSEWQAEMTAIQNTHQSELETIRHHYEHQLKTMRERIEHEEARRRKLQEELVQITTRNDQSLTTVKASFEDVLEEQRTGFQEEMEQLKREHQKELDEEKAATRLALEAVRRAHEEELKAATSRKVTSDKDRDGTRQNAMLEQMREELTNLSAAYSAKCIENAQLDERLSALMEQREREGDCIVPTGTRNDQSLTTVKASFEDVLEEQRTGFQEEMEQLKREHQKELDEEKAATRLALEAVRRAHEEELKAATSRKVTSDKDRDGTRQNFSAMLEQMREELTNLSAAYSAKCIENAQLDERLSALMEQREREGDR
ncbi:hypothetical protein ANCCAN_20603 [Ancylostoma caninum]|uniref:Uncharacterized protein n=1 Tax=Ancylostoma caninum TaxID=29170 RepID=A0A368FN00_ANCCA|nr:hypothetical protein ANCCAN_20603 [Ancylostoma caninum]